MSDTRQYLPTKPCPRARPKSGRKGKDHLRAHGVHDWWSGNEHVGEEAVPYRCPGHYAWLPLEKESQQVVTDE